MHSNKWVSDSNISLSVHPSTPSSVFPSSKFLSNYACMYECMYVRTYVRTYVCMYVCMYVRTYVRMYVYIYVCMYVWPVQTGCEAKPFLYQMYSTKRAEGRRISALKTALPRLTPGAFPCYDAEICPFYLNSLSPIIFVFLHFFGSQLLVRQGFLISEASRSYSDTPHSVGLVWTCDQPDVEVSTWQQTTLTRDRYPCPWRDSKPQSHKKNGRRSRP
jgi:hypothetical protein